MGWRVLGLTQAILSVGALGLWAAVRFMRGNLGPGWSDVVAGGIGLLVMGYIVVIFSTGVVFIGGRRPLWSGWLELTLVPALLWVAIWAAQDLTANGGAPEFYFPIMGLALAGAVACGIAGWRIVSAHRRQMVTR